MFEVVCSVIFGGVNFLVWVFMVVGGILCFIIEVYGCWLIDVDGNCYVDLVCLWGLMIFGYVYLVVVEVVVKVVVCGLFFGVLIFVEI